MKLINILNHHLNGGKFEYKSFDFKKAADEFSKTDEWKKTKDNWLSFEKVFGIDELYIKDKYQIPEDIRDRHSYFRKGKLRKVEFSPNGEIFRVYIGAKYPIAIYLGNIEEVKLIDL